MQPLDLYKQYLAEREGSYLVARPWGFAVYKFEPDFVYLQDIYVVPAERKNGRGIELPGRDQRGHIR
jgi:hypothetical protein